MDFNVIVMKIITNEYALRKETNLEKSREASPSAEQPLRNSFPGTAILTSHFASLSGTAKVTIY